MTFKEWKSWLAELPWALRWFPLLVVLRPIIDNFYFLKETSPFLSPPYIVGVLAPILALNAILTYRIPNLSRIDKAFGYWSFMIGLGCLALLLYDPLSVLNLEFVLKLTMPVYLYFFLRVFISDLRDLHGIIFSFLLSAVFVAILLLYEVLVNPIRVEESRGLERIQGNFGDVVSYGMYIILALISASYFFFSRQHIVRFSSRMKLLMPVVLISFIGLLNIHHTASYAIFIILTGFFLIYNFRSRNQAVGILAIIVIGLVFTFFGSELIEERISPLVETDLAVYSGEQDSDRLLHGRVGRWRLMLNQFASHQVWVQFFGYPWKFDYVYQYIGIGSHNDFVRILFATGIIGLFLYLNFLRALFQRLKELGKAQQYLIISVLAALLFYSISVTPTFYAPFMYFALAVFAYSSLPDKQTRLWKNRVY
jgi:hypothetical protein